MKQLTAGLLDILEGRTHHSKEVRERYLDACVKAGYDVSPVQDLPPLTKMALNYAKAKAKQLLGYKLSPEAKGQRLDQCDKNECGLLRILNGRKRCAHASCGCYLEDKAEDSTAECPKGLWPKL